VYWLISRLSSRVRVRLYIINAFDVCYICVQNSFLYNLFLHWSRFRERLDAGHVLTILKSPHLQWLLNHHEVVLVKDTNQLLVVSTWLFGVWTTALYLLLSWVMVYCFICSHCNHIETTLCLLFLRNICMCCHLNCFTIILEFRRFFLYFLIWSSHSWLIA
jgi:hypothetical protein